MSTVLKLVVHDSRDTELVLQQLLDLAKLGQITGAAICFRRRDCRERSYATGVYKKSPGMAAAATLRMSRRFMQAEDDQVGGLG
jgi:hypothetical protein